MSGNRAGSAPPPKAQVSPPEAFHAHGESHADVAMLLAVLGHDVLRFFTFFSRGRRQGALALKFGSAGSPRVACPTSVPERLEL